MIRQRREVALRDLQVFEDHRARNFVDLRSRGGEHDAERFFLCAGRLDRKRCAKVDLIAVPFVDLRLVDEQRGVGNAQVARPWVRGNGGGRCRRLR